ncbi:MAG: VOC family protein [Acidobacteriota bacterium]
MGRGTRFAAWAATMLIMLAPAWRTAPAQKVNNSNPLQLYPQHVTVSVANIDREEAWYERVFGFKEALRSSAGADYEIRQIVLPTYRIDLVWQKGSVRHPNATPYSSQGWAAIVFKTPAIEADFHKLVADGTDAKADRNIRSAITRLVVHDPEGNEIEIVPE